MGIRNTIGAGYLVTGLSHGFYIYINIKTMGLSSHGSAIFFNLLIFKDPDSVWGSDPKACRNISE